MAASMNVTHLHLIVAHIPNAEIPQRGTSHKKTPAGRVCRRVNHSFGVTRYFSAKSSKSQLIYPRTNHHSNEQNGYSADK